MKTSTLISDFEEKKKALQNKLEELETRFDDMFRFLIANDIIVKNNFVSMCDLFGLDEDERNRYSKLILKKER